MVSSLFTLPMKGPTNLTSFYSLDTDYTLESCGGCASMGEGEPYSLGRSYFARR